mmetsp:Transcript_92419/g.146098  ORF Transcript_92419/g.146098 Transcript_92419/m.146098 type:complete len:217 (-) Transcript_92419:2001-2651(-)
MHCKLSALHRVISELTLHHQLQVGREDSPTATLVSGFLALAKLRLSRHLPPCLHVLPTVPEGYLIPPSMHRCGPPFLPSPPIASGCSLTPFSMPRLPATAIPRTYAFLPPFLVAKSIVPGGYPNLSSMPQPVALSMQRSSARLTPFSHALPTVLEGCLFLSSMHQLPAARMKKQRMCQLLRKHSLSVVALAPLLARLSEQRSPRSTSQNQLRDYSL